MIREDFIFFYSLFLLPIFALFRKKKVTWARLILETLLLGYLFYLASLLFSPIYLGLERTELLAYRGDFTISVNLVPFRTIIKQVNLGLGDSRPARQIGGNIVLFIPLGFAAPILFEIFQKFRHFLTLALILPVFIEFTQLLGKLLAIMPRSVDIDDVILNALGLIIGFSFFTLFKRLYPKMVNSASQAHN